MFDPENWKVKKHDLALLKVLTEKGFDQMEIKTLKEYESFKDINFDDADHDQSKTNIYNRIIDICNICRDEQLGKSNINAQRRPAKNLATTDGLNLIGANHQMN